MLDAASKPPIFGHGTPPPQCDRKTDALKRTMRNAGEWRRIFLKVVGKRAEATLHGTLLTVADAINLSEGYIGPQGEHGQFEWRDLRNKVLSPP